MWFARFNSLNNIIVYLVLFLFYSKSKTLNIYKTSQDGDNTIANKKLNSKHLKTPKQ
jgi:hypothetical protein